MLDLQVWIISEEERLGGKEIKGDLLCWTFYEKPTTPSTVLRAASAYTWRNKLVSMNMEVFRRLRNTSRQINQKERAKIMNKLTDKLKKSGYLTNTVDGMIESGTKYYYRKVRIELQGGPPLNIRTERDIVIKRRQKLGATESWFKRSRGGEAERTKKEEGWRERGNTGEHDIMVKDIEGKRKQQNYNENENNNGKKGRTTMKDDKEEMGRTKTTNTGRQREDMRMNTNKTPRYKHRRKKKHRKKRGTRQQHREEEKTITTLLVPYTVGSELKKSNTGSRGQIFRPNWGKKSESNIKRRG